MRAQSGKGACHLAQRARQEIRRESPATITLYYRTNRSTRSGLADASAKGEDRSRTMYLLRMCGPIGSFIHSVSTTLATLSQTSVNMSLTIVNLSRPKSTCQSTFPRSQQSQCLQHSMGIKKMKLDRAPARDRAGNGRRRRNNTAGSNGSNTGSVERRSRPTR